MNDLPDTGIAGVREQAIHALLDVAGSDDREDLARVMAGSAVLEDVLEHRKLDMDEAGVYDDGLVPDDEELEIEFEPAEELGG